MENVKEPQSHGKFTLRGGNKTDFKDRFTYGENLQIPWSPWPVFDVSGSRIIIGNNVVVSPGVYIFTHSHQFNKKNWRELTEIGSEYPTVISDNVFIGVNAIVTHKCKYIGKYSSIGTNSVVTRNVPDNEIWAGNPARKIGDVS